MYSTVPVPTCRNNGTVEPLHNGHLGDRKKMAVVERWPLWGGMGVI